MFVNNNNMNRIVFTTWSLCDCLFVSSSSFIFVVVFSTNKRPSSARLPVTLSFTCWRTYRNLFLDSLFLDPGSWILAGCAGTYVAYVNIRFSGRRYQPVRTEELHCSDVLAHTKREKEQDHKRKKNNIIIIIINVIIITNILSGYFLVYPLIIPSHS